MPTCKRGGLCGHCSVGQAWKQRAYMLHIWMWLGSCAEKLLCGCAWCVVAVWDQQRQKSTVMLHSDAQKAVKHNIMAFDCGFNARSWFGGE
jgi:hypothetical protein